MLASARVGSARNLKFRSEFIYEMSSCHCERSEAIPGFALRDDIFRNQPEFPCWIAGFDVKSGALSFTKKFDRSPGYALTFLFLKNPIFSISALTPNRGIRAHGIASSQTAFQAMTKVEKCWNPYARPLPSPSIERAPRRNRADGPRGLQAMARRPASA
jgi:hypothetical protein